jgi:hypothetical protein
VVGLYSGRPALYRREPSGGEASPASGVVAIENPSYGILDLRDSYDASAGLRVPAGSETDPIRVIMSRSAAYML